MILSRAARDDRVSLRFVSIGIAQRRKRVTVRASARSRLSIVSALAQGNDRVSLAPYAGQCLARDEPLQQQGSQQESSGRQRNPIEHNAKRASRHPYPARGQGGKQECPRHNGRPGCERASLLPGAYSAVPQQGEPERGIQRRRSSSRRYRVTPRYLRRLDLLASLRGRRSHLFVILLIPI